MKVDPSIYDYDFPHIQIFFDVFYIFFYIKKLLSFPLYKSYAFLIMFISTYFIFVNGSFFKKSIYVSRWLLLVNKVSCLF